MDYLIYQQMKQDRLDSLDGGGCCCFEFEGDNPNCPEHGHYYEDCGCVLPKQSCRVCRAEARKTYTEWEF